MSNLKNAFAGAKGYAVTGLVAASTMVPAFAAAGDDFDTTAVVAKLVLAGAAVSSVGAALALVWVVKTGWAMIRGR